MQKLFSIRTTSDRGQAFLEALHELIEAQTEPISQTEMVMKLVFDERAKVRARQTKGRK